MSLSNLDPAVAKDHVLRTVGQGFLGESRAAASVREQIADFLVRRGTEQPPPPILLRGEAGVGKSLLARLIHRAGPRRDGPFFNVNCAATPEALQEAELFGIEPGITFTDVWVSNAGLFQAANGGSIVLDNLTELSAELQAKLLQVIEERSVRRIGSTRKEPLDVWILAATYQDLREAIDYHRRYREAFNLQENENIVMESLYQHLGQLDLLIPPLRQRPDDILLLAEHYLTRVCAEHHLPPKSFAADAHSAMLAYLWPGNVREVGAVIERVALLFESDVITAAMLSLRNWNEPAGRPRRIRR